MGKIKIKKRQPHSIFGLLVIVMLHSGEVGAHPALRPDNTHFPLLNQEAGYQVSRRQKGHAQLKWTWLFFRVSLSGTNVSGHSAKQPREKKKFDL